MKFKVHSMFHGTPCLGRLGSGEVAKAGLLCRQMAKTKPTVQICILLAFRAVFLRHSGEVSAAQFNTSAANSWIQLEADDSFSGRNGESSFDSTLPISRQTAPCYTFKTTSPVRTKLPKAFLHSVTA